MKRYWRPITLAVLLALGTAASRAASPSPAPRSGAAIGRLDSPGQPVESSGLEYGTTVITHGFQSDGKFPRVWLIELAAAIRDQTGAPTGRIFKYIPRNGSLKLLAGQSGDGETILLFDWAIDSCEDVICLAGPDGEIASVEPTIFEASGWSEAAGDALFSTLLRWGTGSSPLIDLSNLHFIGHSRGAVVNSEAVERLLKAEELWSLGVHIRQVTTLDPHGELSGDEGVNSEHAEYASRGYWTWDGIAFADNYWQPDFLVGGEPIEGAANLDLDYDGSIGHSEVHDWYCWTIPGARRCGGDPTTPGGWFCPANCPQICDATMSQRTEPFEQDSEGYFFTELVGGTRCPPWADEPTPVLFDFGSHEGLVNGNFERGAAAWKYHGGTLFGDSTIDQGRLKLHVDALQRRSFATRNRLWVPAGADTVSYCRQVFNNDPGQTIRFRVRVGKTLALEETLGGTTGGCESFSIDALPYRDSTQTLTFEARAVSGITDGATVEVDNVLFNLTLAP